MKHLLLLLSFVILLSGACHNSRPLSPAAEKKLHSLLAAKQYFKLGTMVNQYHDSLPDQQKLYYAAYLDNVFNRNVECIRDIDKLLKNYAAQLPDSVKIKLGRLQSDSYFKTFQYAKAAKTDQDILSRYGKAMTKEEKDDLSNDILIRTALKATAPQRTIIKNNTTFNWTRDQLGLIEIPVACNGAVLSGIFDTRANISTITTSYAKKLKLHILDVSYNEGSGATGILFKTGMGIADSLHIGDLQVKNVVFQVVPDSILYIAPVKFQLNMIIGFPVIAQMEELHIYKNGKMTVPVKPAKSDLHNFALDGLDPVLALTMGNDTLDFHFDSGAVTSMFYVSYFNKYKDMVLKTAKIKTANFGGAGGSQKKQIYELPKVNLNLAGKTVTLDSVAVLQKKIYPGEHYYGNIGQDFIKQFGELIYNFKDMYVKGN